MRTRLMVLGIGFCLIWSENVVAQSKRLTPTNSTTVARAAAARIAAARKARSPREAMIRSANAAKLMQQRAMRQAQQRRARIEARKWLGISLLRPNLGYTSRPVRDWYYRAGRFDWNYSVRLHP